MSDRQKEYAYLAYRMLGGDDVLKLLISKLTKDGYVDGDAEWLYDGDEDEEE